MNDIQTNLHDCVAFLSVHVRDSDDVRELDPICLEFEIQVVVRAQLILDVHGLLVPPKNQKKLNNI